MGVTELTDAVVVIISEETGDIKICFSGEFYDISSDTELRRKLSYLLSSDEPNKESLKAAYEAV